MSSNTIICKLCNESIGMKGLSFHLKGAHNIKFTDYVKENINDFCRFGWKVCPVCNQNCTNKKTCSRKCGYTRRSSLFSGKNSAWYGRSHSPESIEKISKNRSGKGGQIGDKNPASRPEVRKRISQTRKDRGVAKGSNNPMFGKTHTEESLKKIFDKRSNTKPELIALDIMNKNGFEATTQWFINDSGTIYSYDFFIKDYNLIIEVDGDYWHGGPGVKNHWKGVKETIETDRKKDILAINKGYKIIRIWESELKFDSNILINKINSAIQE